jgi:hypothetical protein
VLFSIIRFYLRKCAMPLLLRRLIPALLALLALSGCAAPMKKSSPLLAPARMSPDCCVLEVFFVRVPFGDPQANEDLWQDLDEQHFSADLRQRLMRNGFRVGLADGQIPVVLSNLLELSDKPPASEEVKGTNLVDLNTKPRVVLRHMQVRAGQPSEVVASGTYEQLPVLLYESGQVTGESFQQAQGFFNVTAFPLPDGRVRLDLIPEVHHDQARQRWIADQGMMRLDSSKPKRIFEDLAISAALSPGGMLVVTSLPNRSGSLGHHFFTENDGRLEQKILVFRLSQTQHDDLFAPSEVLPPDSN